MLTFGVISPHPPIIIPEIGGRELAKVKKTTAALESAAIELAETKPDKVIIIAPHTEHGYEVPLYYLGKHLDPATELEKILVTHSSYQYYFDLGKKYGEIIDKSTQRIAVIASGDLSHVLKAEGPYGYNPAGPRLDEIIVKAIKDQDVKRLLQIDPDILESGAECGLRSILFLFGVFAGKKYSTEVLSYEGPFGVGYMVATFALEGFKR
jgi:AmmeMemoRadiSam system protein B